MLKEDIRKVKDQGKLFDRLSSDYDIGKRSLLRADDGIDSAVLALQKNADASKMKRTWRVRNTCFCR